MPPRRVTRSATASVPPEDKASTSRRKRGRSEVDEVATKEIVEKPPSRAKKPPPTTSRTRTSVRSRTVLKDIPETGEETQPVLGVQGDKPPSTTPKPSPKKALPPPAVESEEEEPLMEPPSPRIPPTQPPPPAPEEPEGPRPRLVIHKMALVNFKSYAGRQEIGPFHKVCKLPNAPPTGLTPVFSHSLRLSAQMGLENLTP